MDGGIVLLVSAPGRATLRQHAQEVRWNDDDLHQLKCIVGADLEVVDTSRLRNGPEPHANPMPGGGWTSGRLVYGTRHAIDDERE
jgi:hypothetical protein